ncbi:sensor histidine kinase [Halobellus clavatus]|uniref:histidine kinase n=1 Tax=Halobellus clavatus TaxID=660517 RepID=A0A1H3HYL5_9EURY|nr:HAMP domain-containing sensor histidine kinase [Halobellus clavatus]SDY20570.1 Signal transduction histidine kinase [Halobellus clavatus]
MSDTDGGIDTITANLPRYVRAVAFGLFAVHLLSFAILRGLSIDQLIASDFHVSVVTIYPFLAAMVYGSRWLKRSELPMKYHARIRNWFVGGLAGFLSLNLVMIATWPAGSLHNNLGWALFAASVGGAAGLGIGLLEARRIWHAIRADRQSQQRREIETQNQRLVGFAESVAHDLRNPLNVAAGNLELARREPSEEYFENIEAAHERMATLIEQSMELARSGRDIDETEEVDLESFVERCWSNVPTGDARLDVEASATVEADPERLSQLLENLLRNAVEHGAVSAQPPAAEAIAEQGSTDHSSQPRADPGLTVSVGPLSDGKGFYVADDGDGIPESERESVLKSGYSSNANGSGLGLAIVSRIAAAHGWQIDIDESVDGGARFEFRIDAPERAVGTGPTAENG